MYDKAGCTPGPRDRDRTPSRPDWRDRMQWGRRCVHMSLSWRCGCATCRAARLRSGSLRNSRRNLCSPSRRDTRSRTPRPAPACVWRCSSEWPWPSADGCLPWVSAFNRTKWQLAKRASKCHHQDPTRTTGDLISASTFCLALYFPSLVKQNVICTFNLPMDPFKVRGVQVDPRVVLISEAYSDK